MRLAGASHDLLPGAGVLGPPSLKHMTLGEGENVNEIKIWRKEGR